MDPFTKLFMTLAVASATAGVWLAVLNYEGYKYGFAAAFTLVLVAALTVAWRKP